MHHIKHLANAWMLFKTSELKAPSVSILEQIRARRAFMAGASIAIALLMRASDAGDAAAGRLLDDLADEIEAFNTELKAGQPH